MNTWEKIRFLLLVFGTVGLIITLTYRISYREGYNTGASLGVKASLDTVLVMLNKQLKSDTTVTKLIIINPDTNVFILSRETLLNSANK